MAIRRASPSRSRRRIRSSRTDLSDFVCFGAPVAFTLRPVSRVARISLVVLAGTLLVVGRISDPYMLALGILPLLVVASYDGLVQSSAVRRAWAFVLLRVVLGAWATAAAVLWLVPYFGGFTM